MLVIYPSESSNAANAPRWTILHGTYEPLHTKQTYVNRQGIRNQYGETEFQKIQGDITAFPLCDPPAFPITGTGWREWPIPGYVTVINRTDHSLPYGVPRGYSLEEFPDAYSTVEIQVSKAGRGEYLVSAHCQAILVRDSSPEHVRCTPFSRVYAIYTREDLDTIRKKYPNLILDICLRKQPIQDRKLYYYSNKADDSGKAETAEIPASWFDATSVEAMLYNWEVNVVDDRTRNEILGNALLNCVNNAQSTDVVNLENLIQLMSDIKDFPSLLANTPKRIIKKMKKQGLLKTAANAKLSYDYSFKTTYSDIKELVRAISRQNRDFNLARGRFNGTRSGKVGAYNVTIRIEEAYKVYYGNSNQSLLPFYRKLQNIGLDPSFEHVWNTIPYSFVVDWILPTATVLKEMDYDTSVSTLPILAVTHGRWVTYHIQKDDGTLTAEFSAYKRDLASDLPDFPYFLPSFSPHMNWWNGGALLIQRLR